MANDSNSPFDDEDSESNRESGDQPIRLGDTLKKVVTLGLGAAFMTEEHIRSYVSELKLPKDVISPILQSAAKSKEELVSRVSNEMVKILSRIDFVKEASRFVEEHKFRVSAEIEVIKRTSEPKATDTKSGDPT